jgi:hypothetical protein
MPALTIQTAMPLGFPLKHILSTDGLDPVQQLLPIRTRGLLLYSVHKR